MVVSCGFFISRFHGSSTLLHGLDNILIAGATAQVALQLLANHLFTGIWMAFAQVNRAHDHSGRAKTALQSAFKDCHGLQCGFCTPGMIMASVDLLKRHPEPTDDQIREGLAGNLCRCTGYVNIVAAVRTAAHQIAASGSKA